MTFQAARHARPAATTMAIVGLAMTVSTSGRSTPCTSGGKDSRMDKFIFTPNFRIDACPHRDVATTSRENAVAVVSPVASQERLSHKAVDGRRVTGRVTRRIARRTHPDVSSACVRKMLSHDGLDDAAGNAPAAGGICAGARGWLRTWRIRPGLTETRIVIATRRLHFRARRAKNCEKSGADLSEQDMN